MKKLLSFVLILSFVLAPIYKLKSPSSYILESNKLAPISFTFQKSVSDKISLFSALKCVFLLSVYKTIKFLLIIALVITRVIVFACEAAVLSLRLHFLTAIASIVHFLELKIEKFYSIPSDLLMENGEPYLVYGVYGRHHTKKDGKNRVKEIKKIFRLARKTGKKIIFVKEGLINTSIESAKEVCPDLFNLTKEEILELSYKDFQEHSKKVFADFNESLENLKKMTDLKYLYLKGEYGKAILKYLWMNRNSIETDIVEHEILGKNGIITLSSFEFFEQKALSLGIRSILQENMELYLQSIKKSVHLEVIQMELRDMAVAQWIDKKSSADRIIIYDRGSAHFYYEIFKNYFDKNHKEILVLSGVPSADYLLSQFKKRLYSQHAFIANKKELLDTPAYEELILKDQLYNWFFSFYGAAETSLYLEVEQRINALTREEVETFLKQIFSLNKESKLEKKNFAALMMKHFRDQSKKEDSSLVNISENSHQQFEVAI